MEHSYSRDYRHTEDVQVMNTRTIMIHRPPQCPSCHVHTHDEVDLEDFYSPPIPSYNEAAAKESMEECEKLTQNAKNLNSDDEDWECSVNKIGWTIQQNQLFERIAKILDLDKLGRLSYKERQHEPVFRRVIIDKSVERFRQALSSVSWDSKLTQWIHGILMDHLPPSYLSAYIEILQSMKAKIPTLVDKMIFGRTGANQDLLRPIFKKPWEPIIDQKTRKLPNQPIIVVVPSAPLLGVISSRNTKLYSLLSTMANVAPIQCNISGSAITKHGLQYVTDQLMSVTRAKIQDIKHETPNRPIILVGFNAGAALAIQIGLVEQVCCVVCLGFAYNTVHGIRGAPDDHILDIITPILFVIGQNSAKVSQEEIESLREKMHAQTSLVVVGSADDSLRVGKTKRKIEGVTQCMVDNMIMDEIAEFATTCLINPPGPRTPNYNIPQSNSINYSISTTKPSNDITTKVRKRKLQTIDSETEIPAYKIKSGKGQGRIDKLKNERPQLTPLTNPSNEALDIAIQSILPESDSIVTSESSNPQIKLPSQKLMTSYEIIPASNTKPKLEIRQISQTAGSQSINTTGGNPVVLPVLQRTVQKMKMIPPNQFIQLKPSQGATGGPKIFTLKPAASGNTNTTTSSQIYTVKTPNVPQTKGNKVYTIKSNNGTQILTTQNTGQSVGSPIVISPKKFTLMKTLSSEPATGNTSNVDLSNTNIFDIPIVFADNDGNLHETTPLSVGSSSSSATTSFVISPNAKIISPPKQMITSTPISTSTPVSVTPGTTTVNRNMIINNLLANKTKQNKLVLINRNAVKTVPNILSSTTKPVPQLKYTKVMVPSSVANKDGTIVTQTTAKFPTLVTTSGQQGQNITILKSGQTVVGSSTGTVLAGGSQKLQPLIINVDGEKSGTNLIKVGDTHIKPQNTILIKSGTGFKQFPMLKTGLLNRNLTVKKVVNLIPQKKVGIGVSESVTTPTVPIQAATSIIQTSPQVITQEDNEIN